jgi:hypothetical protein
MSNRRFIGSLRRVSASLAPALALSLLATTGVAKASQSWEFQTADNSWELQIADNSWEYAASSAGRGAKETRRQDASGWELNAVGWDLTSSGWEFAR